MNPTFHLYGIKITLAGDLQAARDRAHLARLLMFKTKLVNVNNLEIIQNNLRLNDGTHVHFMSQHGFDSATIYVPPMPVVQPPRPRKKIEQMIWPAFEVYTEPYSDGEFKGIVICRGGGFEPPYEFIAKEMFPVEELPYDRSYESAGPLPEERFWYEYYQKSGKEIEKTYEDLEPIGRAYLRLCYENGLPYNSFTTYAFDDFDVFACIQHEDHGSNVQACVDEGWPSTYIEYHYEGVAAAYDTWTSGVDRNDNIVLSYRFEDDPPFESWDRYWLHWHNGSTANWFYPGTKPSRIINDSFDFTFQQNGAGNGRVPRAFESGLAVKVISGSAGFMDMWACKDTDTSYTASDLEEELLALVMNQYEPATPSDSPIKQSATQFQYTETKNHTTIRPIDSWSSAVYDGDIFALVCQERVDTHSINNACPTVDKVEYHVSCSGESLPVTSSPYEFDSDYETGDILVALNQEVFVVDINFANMDRAYLGGEKTKLYKNGDRYDALSQGYVTRYDNSDDWNDLGEILFFNQVTKKGEDPGEIITTIFAAEEPLPDITDNDDNLIYPCYYRLIRETKVIKEQ